MAAVNWRRRDGAVAIGTEIGYGATRYAGMEQTSGTPVKPYGGHRALVAPFLSYSDCTGRVVAIVPAELYSDSTSRVVAIEPADL
eukprot:3749889-Rhodomonas_salina.1